MDHLNDHLATPATTGQAARSVPKRYYLRSWAGHTPVVPVVPVVPVAPVRQSSVAETAAGEPGREPFGFQQFIQQLEAGHAITLRAKALTVLRIAHGRVWVTVTGVGPYSRVIAGDHFLSRGDSLTLLPGQELVMEPFGRGEKTSARFSWGPPGAAAAVMPIVPTAHWRGGVLQPMLDLRHASGQAVRAMGRLVLGLGHAAVAEGERVATYVAIVFIADSADKSRAGSTFDARSRDSGARCRSC